MSHPERRKTKAFGLRTYVLLVAAILVGVVGAGILIGLFSGHRYADRMVARSLSSPDATMAHLVLGDAQFDLGPRAAYAASPTSVPRDLKLVYSAQMSVSVEKKAADEFPAMLGEKVEALGGYVSGASSWRRTGQQPGGRITVRVPSARLSEVMDWIRAMATVLASDLKVEDITEQYVDLEARLGNLLAGEARLKELLAKEAGKLEELLKVEQEIRRVRQEIEQLQGRKRLWDSQTAFSTLTIEYEVATIYRTQELQAQTFGQQVRVALHNSWRAFTEAMAAVAIGCLYALPWLVVLVILVIVGCLWHRRSSRRKGSRSAA
ncbi:MAG TPA: DUF4349 domain-containing protein [Phycisphaerae bacterium]|nr:DUF4349 domain-containing protein [Phycisphaerae bacterium]